MLKAAALSPRVTIANPPENARAALAAIQQAFEQNAQIIALPELFLSGCTCGDLFLQSALIEACEAALHWLAEQTKHSAALIAIGLPARMDDHLYNCAAVLQNGQVLGLVPKQNLSHAEARWFTAGEERAIFQFNSRSVGIEIDEITNQDVDIMLHLAADPKLVGRTEKTRDLLARQSARLHCGYVYASAGKGESSTDTVFTGQCLIAERGHILGGNIASFDFERQPLELPEKLTLRTISPTPFVPQDPQELHERCREIFEIQAAAVAQRLIHTSMNKMILGLSGGGDSTLTLLVTVKVAKLLNLPRENILCITMPGFGTSQFTHDTADALAKAFGVPLREIDIRPACELHMRDIGHDPAARDITYENIQARQRTQTLMNLANQQNALLLGTGCLSELALGWCTYNADHMSMYNPNCGVPKTLVRHLIEHVASKSSADQSAALRRVTATPVSPELLPPNPQGHIAQRTEDEIGPYELHDFFLYHFYRHGHTPEELFAMAVQAFDSTYPPAQIKQTLIVFLRRFFAQQFKRSCLPDGPRIGSVSLSPRSGLVMPSDADASIWLQRTEEIACN